MRLFVGAFSTAFILSTVVVAFASASDAPVKPSQAPLAPLPDAVASSLALVTYQGKTFALVADEDDSTLHVFETHNAAAAPREVSSTKLPGKPGHVAVAPDGRVFVAIRDKGSVSVLEPTTAATSTLTLTERATITSGGEPIGLGVAIETGTLYISSGWSGEVYAYSLATPYELKARLDVAREPRTIAIAKNGNAFVSHGVGGTLSILSVRSKDQPKVFTVKELDVKGHSQVSSNVYGLRRAGGGPRLGFAVTTQQPSEFDRPSTQGYVITKHEGRIYAPETFVDPERPVTYYGDGTQDFGILMIDAQTSSVIETSRELASLSASNESHCLLPRAAAFDPLKKRVLVGCAGSEDILDFDALLATPADVLKRKVRTDDSPAAMAVDNAHRVAVVWSQMGRSLSILPLDTTATITKKPTLVAHASGQSKLDFQIARGRRIFHSIDGRISSDNRACASCHPDGRDDGIAWRTPDGPRQTAMLAGRVQDTAPYGWTRAQPTLSAYIKDTVTRLNGRGLNDVDMRDLVAYVKSLEAPPRIKPADETLVAKGRELFDSAAVGCATCHSGATRTDGVRHDVGTATALDKEKSFETPSLRFVARTGPYFHDGRYATLRELVIGEAAGSHSGKMGNVKQLSEPDQNALIAYLGSL